MPLMSILVSFMSAAGTNSPLATNAARLSFSVSPSFPSPTRRRAGSAAWQLAQSIVSGECRFGFSMRKVASNAG